MNRQHDAGVLLRQYINLANDALQQQKHNAVLSGVVTLLEHKLAGDEITVTVVDEDDATTVARFVTRFGNGQFAPLREVEHGSARQFDVNRSYLQLVVDNAQDYLQHPTRLDWDWLASRVTPVDKKMRHGNTG